MSGKGGVKQPPRLMQSPLTGRVYVVTSYRLLPDGGVMARVKHDVTPDFDAIINPVCTGLDGHQYQGKGSTCNYCARRPA
jgi:hypothetical protein